MSNLSINSVAGAAVVSRLLGQSPTPDQAAVGKAPPQVQAAAAQAASEAAQRIGGVDIRA